MGLSRIVRARHVAGHVTEIEMKDEGPSTTTGGSLVTSVRPKTCRSNLRPNHGLSVSGRVFVDQPGVIR